MNSTSGRKVLQASERKKPARWRASVESLEDRCLLAASLPDIAMISATTADSRGVTFSYEVQNAAISQPATFTFTVYRSADSHFDSKDISIGSVTVLDPSKGPATLDLDGKPATDLGSHRFTLPLADGLPPNPEHPYVLVVADSPNAVAESNEANNTASFRTYVVGVVTHGGIQPKNWKAGPPWERWMARDLREQGYDAVIPYNWVIASNHPGSAVKQGPRLARMVLKTANNLSAPASDPIDVHFIGHSEGAVVNNVAINDLAKNETPQLAAGYTKVTMLDPHSANNGVKGKQYSVSDGFLGWVARMTINRFQARAKDPAVIVPHGVDDTEVFFQHTPISQAQTNHGMYNLWGQVPVHGPAHYFDLTGTGISHAGKFGVQDWYRLNVVPTLSDGSALANSHVLTVSQDMASLAAKEHGRRSSYSGTAAPGATVQLFATRVGSTAAMRVGQTTTNPDGNWDLTTRPLSRGRYQIKALASDPENAAGKPIHMRPTAWSNPLVVDGQSTR